MAADYTPRQGQYLAFSYYHTKIHGVPPAEIDMGHYFQISPPAVHEMVKTLEHQGFISREPGDLAPHVPLAQIGRRQWGWSL